MSATAPSRRADQPVGVVGEAQAIDLITGVLSPVVPFRPGGCIQNANTFALVGDEQQGAGRGKGDGGRGRDADVDLGRKWCRRRPPAAWVTRAMEAQTVSPSDKLLQETNEIGSPVPVRTRVGCRCSAGQSVEIDRHREASGAQAASNGRIPSAGGHLPGVGFNHECIVGLGYRQRSGDHPAKAVRLEGRRSRQQERQIGRSPGGTGRAGWSWSNASQDPSGRRREETGELRKPFARVETAQIQLPSRGTHDPILRSARGDQTPDGAGRLRQASQVWALRGSGECLGHARRRDAVHPRKAAGRLKGMGSVCNSAPSAVAQFQCVPR